jgi:hypothetical protein
VGSMLRGVRYVPTLAKFTRARESRVEGGGMMAGGGVCLWRGPSSGIPVFGRGKPRFDPPSLVWMQPLPGV